MDGRGPGVTNLLGLAWLTLGIATSAHAGSTLRFPIPQDFGFKPAVTHSAEGQVIGKAEMTIERTGATTIRLVGNAAIDTGGSTHVEADFEILGGENQMKLVRQLSESITVEGRPLGTLLIEHEKGTATCTPPTDSDLETVVLPLPENDRVANVPLHLLFAPLARREQEKTFFDVLLCREEPRFMQFEASLVGPKANSRKPDAAEIHYRPALGSVLGFFAQGFVPDLRFWVDGPNKDRYLGHRMPLYTKGPEIWVLREDVSPVDLRPKTPASKHGTADDRGENQNEDRSHASGK